MDINSSFLALKSYCEAENFKGWDPYDGLNSKLFQKTPLKKLALARLVLIQTFKRSPFNLRKLFLVPKQHNAKGIALFLNGYSNIYEAIVKEEYIIEGFSKEHCLTNINYLAKLLIEMKSNNYSGACWGYNFDWQARRLFFF